MHISAEAFITHCRASVTLGTTRCKTICIVSALKGIKSQKANHADKSFQLNVSMSD